VPAREGKAREAEGELVGREDGSGEGAERVSESIQEEMSRGDDGGKAVSSRRLRQERYEEKYGMSIRRNDSNDFESCAVDEILVSADSDLRGECQ
jgi:hypothetical protein